VNSRRVKASSSPLAAFYGDRGTCFLSLFCIFRPGREVGPLPTQSNSVSRCRIVVASVEAGAPCTLLHFSPVPPPPHLTSVSQQTSRPPVCITFENVGNILLWLSPPDYYHLSFQLSPSSTLYILYIYIAYYIQLKNKQNRYSYV
jgi:hypothetical protein